MKRYDSLKQFMEWAMYTLRVGSFSLDPAFDVLRIGRRFVMPKIEFKIAARRFNDENGLNWCENTKLIFYEPMRIGYERTASYYLTPEIADLKLDGKPLPDDFDLTDRRVEAIFPRLEFSANLLHMAIETGKTTLQQAMNAIGDRAVYELRQQDYMAHFFDPYRDDEQLRHSHKACVETAIFLGRIVPGMVLRDYPDLRGEKVRAAPKMSQRSLFSRSAA